MTTFLFIRHGHSEANRDNVFGGQIDAPLTETGWAQARKVAAFVKETYRPDAVYASDLSRAKETAEAVAAPFGLPVAIDERLREIFGGVWEGMTFAAIEKDYPAQFALWQHDQSRVQCPEGENYADVQKRALCALADIAGKHPGQVVVIVTHRCLLRTLTCAWEERPLSELNDCAWLSNCSVSEVGYENGKLFPVKIGQDDFMGDAVTAVNSSM